MKKSDHMSLEQLEKDVWPEPEYNSHLVTTCHKLRKKSLSDFSIEDLRIMIGQGIGLKFLLPKAVDILKENPFAEGDFYAGDLLVAVAKSPEEIFLCKTPIKEVLIEVCRVALKSTSPTLFKSDRNKIEAFLCRLQQSIRQ